MVIVEGYTSNFIEIGHHECGGYHVAYMIEWSWSRVWHVSIALLSC